MAQITVPRPLIKVTSHLQSASTPRIAELAVVAVLFGIAALVRFNNLGLRGLWVDEIVTVHDANFIWTFTRDASQSETHPPLYFLLIWCLGHLGDSEFLYRFPSALFSSLTVLLVYWFGRINFGATVAVGAAALQATSMTLIQFAQQARDYSITIFLLTLCVCLASLVLRNRHPATAVGLALAVALSLYTSYWSLLAIGSLLLCLAIEWTQRRREGVGTAGATIAFAAVFAGFLAWVPWAPQLIRFIHGSGAMGKPAGSFIAALEGSYALLANLLSVYAVGLFALMWGSALYAVARPKSRSWPAIVSFVTVATYVLAIPTRQSNFELRYLVFALPSLYVLVTAGCYRLATDARRLAERHGRWASPGVASAATGLAVAYVVVYVYAPTVIGYYQAPPNLAGWREAAEYVASNYAPGDAIINTTIDYQFYCFPYYATKLRPSIPVITLDRPGAELPASLARVGKTPRLWWVFPSSPSDVDIVRRSLGDRYDVVTFPGTYPAAVAVVRPRNPSGAAIVDAEKENEEVLDAFWSAAPGNWSVLDADGLAHEAAGDVPTAIGRFRESLALTGDNPWVNEDLARVLSSAGAYDEAATWLQSAISVDQRAWNYQGVAWHYLALGMVYLQENRFDQAGATFAEGLKSFRTVTGETDDPTGGYLTFRAAEAYDRQGALDLAEQEYRNAVSYPMLTAEAHRGLARIYLARDQTDRAVDEVRAAIKAAPTSPWPYLDLGDFYRDHGQPDAAFAAYQEAHDVAPQEMWVLLRLGDSYLARQDWSDAIGAYRAAAEVAPDNISPLQDLGGAYLALGRWSDAENAYKAALQLDSSEPDLYDGLGMAVRGQDRIDDALQSFRHGASLDPNRFWLQFHLGETYLYLNDRENALKAFRRANEILPGNRDTLQHISELQGA